MSHLSNSGGLADSQDKLAVNSQVFPAGAGVLPVLGGNPCVCMDFTGLPYVRVQDGLVSSGNALVQGVLIGRDGAHPYQEARRLYSALFDITAGHRLYRIWHYLPVINEVTDGLENYRHFCLARSEVFSERFGSAMEENLAAASAVGSRENRMVIHFLAGTETPKNFENPRQVPAYRYPLNYSPKPPAFVRATKVDSVGRPLWFISGTASIDGSESCHVGNIAAQTELTLENLKTMFEVMALRDTWENSFATVYVRHSHQLPVIQDILSKSGLFKEDNTLYLEAAICRAELDIEIEVHRPPYQAEY